MGDLGIDDISWVLDLIPLSRYLRTRNNRRPPKRSPALCFFLFTTAVYLARKLAQALHFFVELGVGNCVIALVPLPVGPAIAVKVMVDEGHSRDAGSPFESDVSDSSGSGQQCVRSAQCWPSPISCPRYGRFGRRWSHYVHMASALYSCLICPITTAIQSP